MRPLRPEVITVRGTFMGQTAERKWNMKETQGWMIVGLVGGLIATVSLAMPWISRRGIGVGSGWELLGAYMAAPYLLLFGGILSMIGAAVMLWRNKLGMLLPIGGILALLGWVQEINELYYFTAIGMKVGYGFWAGALGLLMILVSSFGLRKSRELAALLKVLVTVLVLIVLMYIIWVITKESPPLGPMISSPAMYLQ